MFSPAMHTWRRVVPLGGGGGPPILIPASRITTWQPGVNYNGGIPSGRTQSGATISPIGQKATFTGTTTNGSNALAVTGVTGTLAADQLVFDAALTQCFGLVVAGAAGSWTFNDGCRTTAASVAMVSYGNDTTPINAALAAAGANTFVKLANGTFCIAANALSFHVNNVTLRGSSQWTGKDIVSGRMPSLSQVATTILWKADHGLSPYGCLYVGLGNNAIQWPASINFALDGAKGSNTVTLAAPYGGAVGDVVLIDQIGPGDPNVFYGNRHDLSGKFLGSINASTLTVANPIKAPLGTDGAFAGTFSATTMNVTSTAATSFVNQLGTSMNPVGTTVFDGASNYYGYILNGIYPGPFTMSQSNSGSHADLILGGVYPQVNYPVFDGVFSAFYGFIQSGGPTTFTLSQSNPTLTSVPLTVGGGSRRFFTRQDRALCQTVKIAAKAGNTVTFETPLHIAYTTAQVAQLTAMPNPSITGAGVEDLTFYWGIGGDGNGNLTMQNCQYSWVKNVQSHFSDGTGIGFYNCYRSQVTQCYCHETPSPNPGGGGYLCGMNSGTSDCLFEDNEMWMGNKVVVMRGTGGGNVIAYNYMDDPLGAGYPMSPEAGVNAGHFVGSHMELMEGNYTHRYSGDSFWGNSPWLTVFRNWCTGLRAKANIAVHIDAAGATVGAATAPGSNILNFLVITNAVWTAGNVTFTTAAPHGVAVGAAFTISGVNPGGYNGSYVASAGTTGSTLVAPLAVNPGAFASGSDNVQGVYVGLVPQNFARYGCFPAGTVVTAVNHSTGAVTLNNNVGVGVSSGDFIDFFYDGPLNNYTLLQSAVSFPYADSWGRSMMSIQTAQHYSNIVGNVLGFSGQPLLGPYGGGFNYTQTTFTYQNLGPTSAPTGTDCLGYEIGTQQDPNVTLWPPNGDATLMRQGNYDFITNSQRWHGIGGVAGSGTVTAIPNSYYLASKPAFFGANAWPWVDPSTGTTSVLPAKARFIARYSLVAPIPPGGQ
jgi:hypothetical protein